MSQEQTGTDTDRDETLAELLRAAGRRREPPAAAYRDTLEVARSAWAKRVGRRRRRIQLAWAATAAAIVGAFGLQVGLQGDAETIAAAERLVGDVTWRAPTAERWIPLRADYGALPRGSRVRTGEGSFAGLRHVTGASLRLAPGTLIRLEPKGEIRLAGGRLYVDSGEEREDEDAALSIVTPVGRATEIGTQFEVSYDSWTLRLRVREGLVRLSVDTGIMAGEAGEELSVSAEGTITEDRMGPQDVYWEWVHAVAPVPLVDGRPLAVLLDWVARETGRPLRYVSPTIREQAMNTVLHGRIRDLAPLEALEVMLATTDLDYALLADGTIEIRPRNRP